MPIIAVTKIEEMSLNTLNESIFSQLSQYEHQNLVFCSDKYTGLKAIIAIHDTTLGPAIGGTRLHTYRNEEEAIEDCLRLSKGMTYKTAITGVNLGGGNAVILDENPSLKSEALLRRFGQFVNQLNGSFLASLDMGTTTRDMETIRLETPHVVGLPKALGGSGDSSPFTARTVYYGIKAGLKELFGNEGLAGRTILVQGAGQVGESLISLLRKENAKVFVTDINMERMYQIANKYGAEPVSNNNPYGYQVDVYAPCALGGTLNDYTIERLKCKIIAGSANNQLRDEEQHAQMLLEKGILYVPDYMINAGGLISCYSELAGYSASRTAQLAEDIYDATRSVLQKSKAEHISSHQAANNIAEDRIEAIRNIKNRSL